MASKHSAAGNGHQAVSSVPWRNRIVGYGEEDAEQLLANPKNFRIHPKNQQLALENSLDKLGWIQNCVVNQTTGFVVDGHARAALAISRGEKVPCAYVELSPEEEAVAIAILDSITEMAVKDQDILGKLIDDIRESDLGQNLGAGLDDLLESLSPKGMGTVEGEDDVPPVPDAPVSRLGDLWRLGEHRVLCGDSTSVDAVARLMDGQKADMVLTDPPYGMRLDADWSDCIGSIGSIGRKRNTQGNKYAPVIGDSEDYDPAFLMAFFASAQATLDGHGATFEHVKAGRRLEAQDAIKEEVLTSPTGAQGAPAPEDRADTPITSAPRQPAARKRGKVAK